VLLVENSESDRQLVRNWLGGAGLDVYEAVDLITGLAACPKYQPDLILLQLRLRSLDGLEMLRRLKEDPQTRSIPVLLLAAAATTAEKVKGFDLGAVDFVSKPFDPIELLARVRAALRTKHLLDLLEQRAHLDGLTELGNRRALEERLPPIRDACLRHGRPLAVLIADLDHFKRINDRHGHAAGDEVLRHAALVLRQSVRSGDFIARYGGEEFVVVAPDCQLAGALAIAERFRAGVADLRIAFHTVTIRLTASVGVAATPDPVRTEPFDLLARADQALYRAKESGRDAVWVWDQDRGTPITAAEALAHVADAPAETDAG
jgi:diguanylate cyclase (GGDEF)-like protein